MRQKYYLIFVIIAMIGIVLISGCVQQIEKEPGGEELCEEGYIFSQKECNCVSDSFSCEGLNKESCEKNPKCFSFSRGGTCSCPACEIYLEHQCLPKLTIPFEKTPQELCEIGGGAWKEFPNDGKFCHDECSKPENVICTRFMSMGCDCGQDKCWDGTSCAPETKSGTKDLSEYCRTEFEATGKCPEDKCEIGCGTGGALDIGGCPVGCNPKPCSAFEAEKCPLENCQIMENCKGEKVCYFKFAPKPPKCGEEGYYGQDVPCCEGLRKKCDSSKSFFPICSP